MKEIYLDYASTTPVSVRVAKVIETTLRRDYGNPGSIHRIGISARGILRDARSTIAKLVHATSDEIVFTSGATEANNLAITGTIAGYRGKVEGKGGRTDSRQTGASNFQPHIIASKIEHHSVLRPIQNLEKKGVSVTWLSPDGEGLIQVKDVREAIRPETVLVSVMYANNEIGSVEPIKEIARVVREYRREHASVYPYVHTDAAQAPGVLPIIIDSLGVDLASFSAQKFYGPKGIGFLYKRSGVELAPLLLGGDQEGRVRAGTENVPYITGMALALEEAEKFRAEETERLMSLRSYLKEKITRDLPEAHYNGPMSSYLPGISNFSFPGVPGEQMVIELDARGVAVATGSACTTESTGPSHVLTALGLDRGRAEGAVRFSFGRGTKKRDLDYVIKCIKEVINKQKTLHSHA